MPISDSTLAQDFQPRTPTTAVQRRIVSVYGGISQIGRYDVVALAATPDTPATALARPCRGSSLSHEECRRAQGPAGERLAREAQRRGPPRLRRLL